jgi:hypothetical protein
MVTVQGGYGTCFCSHGINLLGIGAIAVQTKVRPLLSHDTEIGSKALVQYRGTNMIGAGISHGSVILLTETERIRVWNYKYFSYRQK